MLSFLAPETHLDVITNAIFVIGAGLYCAWQTLGEWQFMPLAGSNAFIGRINQL